MGRPLASFFGKTSNSPSTPLPRVKTPPAFPSPAISNSDRSTQRSVLSNGVHFPKKISNPPNLAWIGSLNPSSNECSGLRQQKSNMTTTHYSAKTIIWNSRFPRLRRTRSFRDPFSASGALLPFLNKESGNHIKDVLAKRGIPLTLPREQESPYLRCPHPAPLFLQSFVFLHETRILGSCQEIRDLLAYGWRRKLPAIDFFKTSSAMVAEA